MAATLIPTCDPGEGFARSSVRSRSFPERAICGYFKWLPALWLLGLILPLAFVVIFASFLLYVRSRRAIRFALPWFAVGSAQYLSVVINWAASREPAAVLLKHLLASYVSGWFLLGAAIGIGASGIIEPSRLLRSIARVGYYSICLAIPAYLLAFCLRSNSLFLISPIGHFIPVSFASRNFAFGIFVYNWEDLGGILLPRLSLMSPWPTAMGAAGVCMVFIAMNLKSKWERGWCMAGGVLMIISSMGRLAVLTLAICLLLRWFLNWRRPYQVCFAYVMLLLVVVGLLVQDPQILAHSFVDRFNEARPGASEVRDEVYEANWKGFSEAPLFGHGWPGGTILDDDPVYGEGAGMMVVGSHSTVSGLLYKGGILTFSLFLFAFMFTVWGLLRRRDSTPLKDNLMIILAIGFTCFGEGLESLVLPLLFAFLWIGTSLGARAPDEYGVIAVHRI
jgi:hypothetical protein